ncbi:MAG: acyltransferase domain-containing protein [SAR324 cluster bacterium]|nr:acyltransferase domain-containing protein [SAR324 cluster bacterium]
MALCRSTIEQLESSDANQHYQILLESSQTCEIPAEAARIGFVAESLEETNDLLKTSLKTLESKIQEDSWTLRKGIYYCKQGLDLQGKKVVALFSGQGSQYVGMMDKLKDSFASVRESFHTLNTLFHKERWTSLSEIVFPHPAEDKETQQAQEAHLTRTEHAQPAIGAVSVGLYKILQKAGLKVDATIGHSFGELTALWAAGVFTDKDYFFLAKERGKAMAAPEDPEFDAGGMLAVKADIAQIAEEAKKLPGVFMANLNSNTQVVLAGAKKAVHKAEEILKEKGYSAVILPVSAAFHTSLVKHAQKPFADAIHSIAVRTPKIPVYSNTTGDLYPEDPHTIKAMLEKHILNPVLFKQQIEKAYEDGASLFIEFGPKNILSSLVSNILGDKPHTTVALNPNAKKNSMRQLWDSITHLRILGVNLDSIKDKAHL